MIVLATLTIFLRFWSRAIASPDRGPKFWWDDWAALASLPFTITSISLVLYMISLGLGRHVTEIPQSKTLEQLKVLYACYILYDTSITFPKISALLFYARIFGTQNKAFRYMLWLTHFLVIGWLLSIMMLGVFLCDPVEKQWKPYLDGHCKPNSALWLGSAIPSVVIDLILLLLPLPMLWRLQMKKQRRILIMTVFAFGYCVIVISLGRMVTVVSTADDLNADLTYASVPTFYWLCAEAPVSTLSVCLPSIFFLARRAIKEGPKALFKTSTGPSRSRIGYRAGDKALEAGKYKDALAGRASSDFELEGDSFDSSRQIYTGATQNSNYPAAATASYATRGDQSLQSISDQAIHVRSDVRVESGY
ncbi:MAG: hypothetical protein Q9222_004478 [Ikaeria aurantiellina]